MNRTKVIVALVATLISTAAISTPALAQSADNKVYAGSTCKPITSGTPGLFYGNNNARNVSNGLMKVVCPVVRDNTLGPVGSGPNAFIDVSSNAVSCSLDTTTAFGTATFASNTVAPVAVGGVFRFDIQAVPQVSGGAYNVTCTLPPNTRVWRYSVSE